MGAQTKDRADLDAGEIHDILRNDRRRLAIKCLREQDGALSVRDLSEEVATRETGEAPAPRDKRRSVYVSLHQTHLPKLDDLGIVDYDPDGKTVELAANADALEAYLDVHNGVPPGYYAGLGLLGGTALLGAVAGVPGLRAVGPAGVGFALSAALVGAALYEVRS